MKHTSRLALLTTFLLCLVLIAPASSQDAPDLEPREVVLEAMAKLAGGYTYTVNLSIEQHYIGDDDEDDFDVYTTQSVTGAVAANGDYQLNITIRAGDTPDFSELPSFEMAHVRVDDTLFLNLADIEAAFGDILSEYLDPGWHNVDDLLALLDDHMAQRIVIENLASAPRPTKFPLTDALILSVKEEASTTIDDVKMRVFEVEIDALQVMLEQVPGDTLDTVRMVLENINFLNKSDLHLTYTLWIGADDGLLYRGETVGRNFLPYLTEDVSSGPPYDLDISSTADFTILQHGAVGEISLPEEVAALIEP